MDVEKYLVNTFRILSGHRRLYFLATCIHKDQRDLCDPGGVYNKLCRKYIFQGLESETQNGLYILFLSFDCSLRSYSKQIILLKLAHVHVLSNYTSYFMLSKKNRHG